MTFTLVDRLFRYFSICRPSIDIKNEIHLTTEHHRGQRLCSVTHSVKAQSNSLFMDTHFRPYPGLNSRPSETNLQATRDQHARPLDHVDKYTKIAFDDDKFLATAVIHYTVIENGIQSFDVNLGVYKIHTHLKYFIKYRTCNALQINVTAL